MLRAFQFVCLAICAYLDPSEGSHFQNDGQKVNLSGCAQHALLVHMPSLHTAGIKMTQDLAGSCACAHTSMRAYTQAIAEAESMLRFNGQKAKEKLTTFPRASADA